MHCLGLSQFSFQGASVFVLTGETEKSYSIIFAISPTPQLPVNQKVHIGNNKYSNTLEPELAGRGQDTVPIIQLGW